MKFPMASSHRPGNAGYGIRIDLQASNARRAIAMNWSTVCRQGLVSSTEIEMGLFRAYLANASRTSTRCLR